jgi:hypothetical protein
MALLAGACGDDATRPEAAPAGTTASSTATAARDGADDWCDSYADLAEAPDPDPEALRAAAGSAPPELDEPLGIVLSDDTSLEPAELLDAVARIEGWAHEHCGTDHPFCTLWTQYAGALGSAALSGVEPEDEEVRALLDGMFEVAVRYAPDAVDAPLDVIASTPTTELRDDEERAAEAAYDEVDAWVADACEDSG